MTRALAAARSPVIEAAWTYRDTFARTVAPGGWGTADCGIAWVRSGASGVPASDLSVSDGAARVVIATAGDMIEMHQSFTAKSISQMRDQRWRFRVKSSAGRPEIYFYLRHLSTAYYFSFSFDGGNAVWWVSQTIDWEEIPNASGSGAWWPATYTPDEWWWIEAIAIGSYPTRIAAKAWRDGGPEPVRYQYEATDSTPQTQDTVAKLGLGGTIGGADGAELAFKDMVGLPALHRDPRLVWDTFSRTATNGFGGVVERGAGLRRAVGVGGSYDDLAVNGRRATLRIDNTGGGRGMWAATDAPSVVADTELSFTFTVDALNAYPDYEADLYISCVSDDGLETDGFVLGLSPGWPNPGETGLWAGYWDPSYSTFTNVGPASVAAPSVEAGVEYRCRARISGTVTPRLQLKVWKRSEEEPDWQLDGVSDQDPRVTQASPTPAKGGPRWSVFWDLAVGVPGTVNFTVDDLEVIAARRVVSRALA